MTGPTTPDSVPETPPAATVDPAPTDHPWSDPPLRLPLSRLSAVFEVVICSGYPTQLIIWVMLAGLGMAVASDTGQLSLLWIVTLSMADTALLVGLVVYFLLSSGDRPRAIFLGTRPIRSELRLGVYLVPVTFFVAFALLVLLSWLIPSLRNVPENPFEVFLRSPASAGVFAVVAVVAGGVREELQRAFILVPVRAVSRRRVGWLGYLQCCLWSWSLPARVGRGGHHRTTRRLLGSHLSHPT